MPHRLLLVRHAKAGDAPVDADRPLTGRGERQAAALGSWLAESRLVPDVVVVSPARRAAQTWERAATPLGAAPEPVVEPRIYVNTVQAVLGAVRETDDDVQTLAVVGHNPSIGQLAYDLDDGEGDPEARRDLEQGFPTAAVAVFTLATPFGEVAPETATLTHFRAFRG
jgi:phosphohistidine phosphatase